MLMCTTQQKNTLQRSPKGSIPLQRKHPAIQNSPFQGVIQIRNIKKVTLVMQKELMHFNALLFMICSKVKCLCNDLRVTNKTK